MTHKHLHFLFISGLKVSYLFAGAAESGKSTLVKQMKIIHNEGFTLDELIAFKVRL